MQGVREGIIRGWLRGFSGLKYRKVEKMTELSKSNSYITKGYVGDYDVEYSRRSSYCDKKLLSNFDVT